MRFTGINDTGVWAERIQHETDSAIDIEYDNLFYKRFLKIVTSVCALHPTVTISFNPDDDSVVFPLLFSYALDHDKSHFSVYIMPFVQ
jgi:hypothetical protein